MTLRELTLGQLDALIKLGQNTCSAPRNESGYSTASETDLWAFRTSAVAGIARVAGRDSEFYRAIPPVPPGAFLNHPSYSHLTEAVLGAVMALRAAVQSGQLETLERRVRSNTYDDFLTQAEELIKAKPSYHVAAMVLVGGVLEDHLRTTCVSKGVTWKGRDGLAAYNDALKEVAYSQPVWRRVQVVSDHRNAAAHGGDDAAALRHDDVEDDLRWVRKLLGEDSA